MLGDFMHEISYFCSGTSFLHPNATNSPVDVLFYIIISQSSTKTERLMNYLLQNATGNKTSWYEDVTSYLYLSNLPVALVRTIPLACSENFSLWEGPGEDPDDQWWEKGVVGEAVKVAKDCLEQVIDGCIWVVSGQFLVDIGTAIWEWGCGASKAVGDKLSDIKTVVVEALARLGEWIVEKIGAAFEVLVNGRLSNFKWFTGFFFEPQQGNIMGTDSTTTLRGRKGKASLKPLSSPTLNLLSPWIDSFQRPCQIKPWFYRVLKFRFH